MLNKNMSIEQKQIKIAVTLGWVMHPLLGWIDPTGTPSELPNFFHNLNAMHEAEKMLDDVHYAEYATMLSEMAYRAAHGMPHIVISRGTISPPAHQRAEAFGKTLKLW
jgi:hypothetical protein